MTCDSEGTNGGDCCGSEGVEGTNGRFKGSCCGREIMCERAGDW